jgi:hypothetical protein
MRRRQRVTGEPAATRHTGGRRPSLDADSLTLIARLIREQNDLTLSEGDAQRRIRLLISGA